MALVGQHHGWACLLPVSPVLSKGSDDLWRVSQSLKHAFVLFCFLLP